MIKFLASFGKRRGVVGRINKCWNESLCRGRWLESSRWTRARRASAHRQQTMRRTTARSGSTISMGQHREGTVGRAGHRLSVRHRSTRGWDTWMVRRNGRTGRWCSPHTSLHSRILIILIDAQIDRTTTTSLARTPRPPPRSSRRPAHAPGRPATRVLSLAPGTPPLLSVLLIAMPLPLLGRLLLLLLPLILTGSPVPRPSPRAAYSIPQKSACRAMTATSLPSSNPPQNQHLASVAAAVSRADFAVLFLSMLSRKRMITVTTTKTTTTTPRLPPTSQNPPSTLPSHIPSQQVQSAVLPTLTVLSMIRNPPPPSRLKRRAALPPSSTHESMPAQTISPCLPPSAVPASWFANSALWENWSWDEIPSQASLPYSRIRIRMPIRVRRRIRRVPRLAQCRQKFRMSMPSSTGVSALMQKGSVLRPSWPANILWRQRRRPLQRLRCNKRPLPLLPLLLLLLPLSQLVLLAFQRGTKIQQRGLAPFHLSEGLQVSRSTKMEHTSSLKKRMRRAMMAIMTLQPTIWMDGTMMRIGTYQGMKMQPFGWTWARQEFRRNLTKQSRGQQISDEASSGRNDPWKESLKVCVSVERALFSLSSSLSWPYTLDAGSYDQSQYLSDQTILARTRSNSYNSHPGQTPELGPLARIPSPDPDHIDGLHRHNSHSSGHSNSTAPMIPPLKFSTSPPTIIDTPLPSSFDRTPSLFQHPAFNSSAPALSMISSSVPTLTHRSATAPTKKLAFATNLSVYDTFPAAVYDRRSEPATWSRLTPALAQRIKEELNSYKMEEMEVHAASRIQWVSSVSCGLFLLMLNGRCSTQFFVW